MTDGRVIDTVIWDLCEVWLQGMEGVEDRIAEATCYDAAEILDVHLHGQNMYDLFRGKKTEDEFFKIAMREHGYPQRIGDIDTLAFLKQAMRENFTELKGSLDVIQAVNRQVSHYALVSDHCREWAEYKMGRFPIQAHFPTIFWSYETGYTKKEEEIFLHVLDRMGADGDRTLFIDDSPKNCPVALQAGIRHVHQWRGPAHFIATAPQYGLDM